MRYLRGLLPVLALVGAVVAVDHFAPSPLKCENASCAAGSALEELLPLPKPAYAGPEYVTQLTSADAGCTQTVQLLPNQSYCVQAQQSKSCIKLQPWDGGVGSLPDAGFAGVSPDCTKDFLLPPPFTTAEQFCFDTAGTGTAIAACNVDAGVSTVNLYRLKKNVVDPLGRPTTGGL